MAYTDKAMISVLQKAEAVAKTNKMPVPITLDDADEKDCYRIAVEKSYIADCGNQTPILCYDGLLELSRLNDLQTDKEQRQQREKLRLGLSVFAAGLSVISIMCSAGTLWIIALDRYRPLITEHPVRIVGAVEILSNQAPSTDNREKDTQSCESDPYTGEACCNVHEN